MNVSRISIVLLAFALTAAGCGKKQEQKLGLQPGEKQAAAAPGRSIEEATAAAVAFLKGHQNDDGSFGTEIHDVGITGMTLYGIAADPGDPHGPQAAQPDVKQILDKGAAFLLANVQDDGAINNEPPMLAIYRTSLAVLALNAIDAEKYKETIENAQKFLTGGQLSETNGNFNPQSWEYGGWSYPSSPEKMGKIEPDLSNLQFAISALKESGLPDDAEAYRRALAFIQRCQNRSESNDQKNVGNDGGGYYSPKESKAGPVTLADGTTVYKSYGSMTYALLKSYIFCGVGKDDPRVQAAYDWITQHYSIDENPGMGQMGLYYYYISMARALAAMGVDEVKTGDGRTHDWRAELSGKIISLQASDGSWANKADRWMEGDPTLVTGYALATLNLCRK